MIGAHVTLDAHNSLVGIGDSLTLCHLADHSLTGLGEGYHRGGSSGSFGIGDNGGFTALKHSHARVGCTKIYTNNFSHNNFLLKYINRFVYLI